MWRDPAAAGHIYINGSRLAVAANLLSFLQHSIEHDLLQGRPVWIDAVCISQGDDMEKSVQVQQMWKIYTHAAHVFVWLGPEEDHSSVALESLASAKLDGENEEPDWIGGLEGKLEHRFSDTQLTAITTLSRNHYFSRMWILQELLLADAQRGVTLCMGRLKAPLWTFLRVIVAMRVYTPPSAASGQAQSIGYFADLLVHGVLGSLEDDFDLLDQEDAAQGVKARYAWRSCALNYAQHACFDPRDRVFALLGLANVRESDPNGLLQADYTMTVDDLATALISHLDCGVSSPRYWTNHDTCDVVQRLLNVKVGSAEFTKWLRARLYWNGERGQGSIVGGSGRAINCTGKILQHALRYGPAECPFKDGRVIKECGIHPVE
ncbi:hypothetical protein AC579_9361 [Pseudocercospora musae]|uniref:Heterokaryon incompatibility domain-containing protein n=1 Tax=Pseudocercospora musae TaxID=113226 RepID=A0A139I2K5_9PEZI|nr:hypothetical protein AC579_9361 [Pseudocercospora musae]